MAAQAASRDWNEAGGYRQASFPASLLFARNMMAEPSKLGTPESKALVAERLLIANRHLYI